MALKLKKEINKIEHEYWVAETHYNSDTKKTQILIRLYTNETLRISGQKSIDRIAFPLLMDGAVSVNSDVYAHIKQSIKSTSITEESGNSVINEIETNDFYYAEDIL